GFCAAQQHKNRKHQFGTSLYCRAKRRSQTVSDSPEEAERERAEMIAMDDKALDQAIQETRSVIWGISEPSQDHDLASRHLGRLLLERDRRRRSLDRLRIQGSKEITEE